VVIIIKRMFLMLAHLLPKLSINEPIARPPKISPIPKPTMAYKALEVFWVSVKLFWSFNYKIKIGTSIAE
jgi:hypothetical protein